LLKDSKTNQTWSSVLKSCQIADPFTGEPEMFTMFVMFGIVHDLRVDGLQAEGHDQGVDNSVLGQEVARLVPVPRVRHNLGLISPTFSVQFLCMQISKAPKDTDRSTEFLHFWDLRSAKLCINMLVKLTPGHNFMNNFVTEISKS
jgi:hypothetical protein